MKDAVQHLIAGLRAMVVFTVVLGALYPVAVWAAAQLIAPQHANGSLVVSRGNVVGSRLIAQGFSQPEWMWPRDSAAGEKGYDGLASGGTNYGPNSPELLAQVQERKQRFGADAPPEALTASASGLDPDISPRWAALQVPRIAKARGVAESTVKECVARATSGRMLGFLGMPRVNVLEVNLCLARRP